MRAQVFVVLWYLRSVQEDLYFATCKGPVVLNEKESNGERVVRFVSFSCIITCCFCIIPAYSYCSAAGEVSNIYPTLKGARKREIRVTGRASKFASGCSPACFPELQFWNVSLSLSRGWMKFSSVFEVMPTPRLGFVFVGLCQQHSCVGA